MGQEKDSASSPVQQAQVPQTVDQQEPAILAWLIRFNAYARAVLCGIDPIELLKASVAWSYLRTVITASRSFPDHRTASNLTQRQIELGQRSVANGWYNVELTPAYRVWVPRTVLWAAVLLAVFGSYRNDSRYLKFGQTVCVTFFTVVPLLNLLL